MLWRGRATLKSLTDVMGQTKEASWGLIFEASGLRKSSNVLEFLFFKGTERVPGDVSTVLTVGLRGKKLLLGDEEVLHRRQENVTRGCKDDLGGC